MIDVDEIRRFMLMGSPLPNIDALFTFYYDETNNVRKLYLTPDGMNIRHPECFVLGGIVHQGNPRAFDLAPLRNAMRLQPSVKEIKLRHLGDGGFLELLASPKLETYLSWLTKEELLVHYQAIDLLYWSIVDIVDSIADEAMHPQLHMLAPLLKEALYTILRADIDATAALLKRYDYPNVGPDRRAAFIAELLEIVEHCEGWLDHFAFYNLKGLLQIARGIESLPYLEDETPDVLVDGFGQFFQSRLCLFKASHHILDDEKKVEAWLEARPLTVGGKPLRHFRFANSQSEPGIQLSVPITGLLGKLFSYLGRTSDDELEDDISGLTDQQRRSLSLLAKLIDASTDICPGFAQCVISTEDRRRASFVIEEVGLSC